MRKVIMLLSLVTLFSIYVSADSEGNSNSGSETGVFMDYYIKGHEGSSTQVNRSTVEIPSIEVLFSTDKNILHISSHIDTPVNITIYNKFGHIAANASSLNISIQLSNEESYTIYIEGIEWYGIGNISTGFTNHNASDTYTED